ncbi:hypothetical protein EVAR_60981_1 [Eumeta japonica]|uniref:Uncharacterized protein n=1 Tax=Eumeta variegata TaxID=151549 RepID=A0A4C1XW96_EUMVA|nr:hypothetical protein EVAR_60981_1 [Eumeta japonica]
MRAGGRPRAPSPDVDTIAYTYVRRARGARAAAARRSPPSAAYKRSLSDIPTINALIFLKAVLKDFSILKLSHERR